MSNVLEKFSLKGAVLIHNFQEAFRPFSCRVSIVCDKFIELGSLQSVYSSKGLVIYNILNSYLIIFFLFQIVNNFVGTKPVVAMMVTTIL